MSSASGTWLKVKVWWMTGLMVPFNTKGHSSRRILSIKCAL
eukprot:CAMPEP_0184323946 /NCGR_PEP_ID=MMETSP1049-20130417/132756_1 /TAXON_ID=77928 /ORGANISM="Proteomonas sulcata, Strain CCMP704" /LENGTH=40 /DNA_ID= /DNA_START= /DNA_END= /DNA_ORIENTATION=